MNLYNLLKKIGLLGLSFSLGIIFVTPAFATNNRVMEKVLKQADVSGTPNTANQQTKIDNVKQRANQEIDRRVNSLSELITKVNTIKRLSATEKASFVSGIQSEMDALNNLKNKISADTDLQTLRTDVQSIVSSYRVYALYVPQLRILVTADMVGNTADNFTTLANKLQTRINEEKATGKDIATLQASLDQMKKAVSDSQTEVQNVISAVTGLTPSGYPGNKTNLQTARTTLQTARMDLNSAWKYAKEIIQGLRKEKTMEPSGMQISPQ